MLLWLFTAHPTIAVLLCLVAVGLLYAWCYYVRRFFVWIFHRSMRYLHNQHVKNHSADARSELSHQLRDYQSQEKT